jgi:hypothetical protein
VRGARAGRVPGARAAKKTTTKKAAPKAAAVPPKTATPDITCPSLIGMGVKTVRSFCDVPAAGIRSKASSSRFGAHRRSR